MLSLGTYGLVNINTAKVIGITQPIIEGIGSADEFIAYCARVSNPSNQMNKETAPKLLKYLIQNKHWSPWEMVHVVMDIYTTRDIGRQILRHKFSFQEFSQRYADPTEMEFVGREPREQDPKNRQNSIPMAQDELTEEWDDKLDAIIELASETYKWAIDNNIAKEQARVVLPEGLTPTRMYMSGTLRSWIHYCRLRMSNGTQKEHSDVAESAWNELLQHFPTLNQIDWEQIKQ